MGYTAAILPCCFIILYEVLCYDDDAIDSDFHCRRLPNYYYYDFIAFWKGSIAMNRRGHHLRVLYKKSACVIAKILNVHTVEAHETKIAWSTRN